MRKYLVILRIEIDGRPFEYGEVAELDVETAVRYAHALQAIEEGEANGGHE